MEEGCRLGTCELVVDGEEHFLVVDYQIVTSIKEFGGRNNTVVGGFFITVNLQSYALK